jgi:hypothetical protein
MVNVVIDDNREDPAVVLVMLQGPPSWEFHFWIHLSELARLRSLRKVNWTARRSVQLGEDGAGTPAGLSRATKHCPDKPRRPARAPPAPRLRTS